MAGFVQGRVKKIVGEEKYLLPYTVLQAFFLKVIKDGIEWLRIKCS